MIIVDDRELQNYSQRMSWMTKLRYVPQTPYIFDGTIAENIAFEMDRKNIDTNQVLKCCHMAAMDDFLYELPFIHRGTRRSLNSWAATAGFHCKGAVSEPELLIFDEATSALDNTNEKAIQKTIYSLRGKQTMIIVAHRYDDCGIQ